MIVVRKTDNVEENGIISEMLIKNKVANDISHSSINYIIEDNCKIVGGCNFDISSGYSIINFLIIDEDRRGEKLGDGLLRSILNYCLINGITKAFFIGENQYFLSKGFSYASKALIPDILKDSVTILECDIEEFFKKGCSSCKRS